MDRQYPVYDAEAQYIKLVEYEANIANSLQTTLIRLDKRFLENYDASGYRDQLYKFVQEWSLNVQRFIDPNR